MTAGLQAGAIGPHPVRMWTIGVDSHRTGRSISPSAPEAASFFLPGPG